MKTVLLTFSVALSAAFASAQQPATTPSTGRGRPTAPAAPAQAAPAPAPFPAGAKIAYVNLQLIAASSADGKAANGKVNALVQKKQAEAQTRQKALSDNQTKLSQGGAVLSEAARTQLQKEIEKETLDAQRFQQDAQGEIQRLQQELQGDFQKKLFPILQQMAQEKHLSMLVSAQDAGLIWAEPGLDLTAEAIKRLDATNAAAPKPAAK